VAGSSMTTGRRLGLAPRTRHYVDHAGVPGPVALIISADRVTST
jgi:hypothetical protein